MMPEDLPVPLAKRVELVHQLARQQSASTPLEEFLFDTISSLVEHIEGPAGRHVMLPSRIADARLTKREQEVLQLIVGGETNKTAGQTLGISPRTVEIHRLRVMEKLNAKNTADLVRLVVDG